MVRMGNAHPVPRAERLRRLSARLDVCAFKQGLWACGAVAGMVTLSAPATPANRPPPKAQTQFNTIGPRPP